MQSFEYASPLTTEDAVALLSVKEGEAAVLAGGTDLLSLMKDGVVTPSRVVNLKSIAALRGIDRDAAGGLRVGATVSLDDLLANEGVRADYPALAQAAEGVRSMQIRSQGTVGGDLCQRPYCWYFRSGFGLLGTKDGKALVPVGDNRYHAILGNAGPAKFVSPSSLAPALIALGAGLRITGPKGERQVSLAEFYRAPRTAGEKEYALAADEIVTDVFVPAPKGGRSATYEVREKEALDWPLAVAAVSFALEGGRIRSPRVVLGQLAPTPWPARGAERYLNGKSPDEAHADRAGEEAVKGARPLSMNGYKVRLARVAVKRAVLRAAGKEV
jgi:xanthine dehydrogenase YagS FAD-binding subunit